MSIAPQIVSYLNDANIAYNLIHHKITKTAFDSAHSAHLPTSNVVKSVLLQDTVDNQYVVALVPANHRVNLAPVNKLLNRNLVLANFTDANKLFTDCSSGVVPGLVQAYNVELIWDLELKVQKDLYLEAGNHQHLIHVNNQQFMQLFEHYPSGLISSLMDYYASQKSPYERLH